MASREESLRFNLEVDNFCNKFDGVKSIAELEALDLDFNSTYSLFQKPVFDEVMAKAKVDVAARKYEVTPSMDDISDAIAQHYVDTVKFLHTGVDFTNPTEELLFRPRWSTSCPRRMLHG